MTVMADGTSPGTEMGQLRKNKAADEAATKARVDALTRQLYTARRRNSAG